MPNEFPRCRVTTWAEADGWADRIAEAIQSAHAMPDAIVALTRGGWVPGRLVADRLGLARLISLRAQHWGTTAMPSGKAELTEGLSAPVKGLKILVVDDITDTGESLALATEHVKKAGAARTESAACLHIGHSKFRPTYFAEEIDRGSWVWVVFPWNFWEDLRTLAGRAAAEDPSPMMVRALLQSRCGWSVSLAEVTRALREQPSLGPH